MTMATRIVVMKDGWIQQISAPRNLTWQYVCRRFHRYSTNELYQGRVGDDGFFECGDHKHGVSRCVYRKNSVCLKKKISVNRCIGHPSEDIKDDAADIRNSKMLL